jgi:hypothetical protein
MEVRPRRTPSTVNPLWAAPGSPDVSACNRSAFDGGKVASRGSICSKSMA